MTKRTVSIFLLLSVMGLISGCSSHPAEQAKPTAATPAEPEAVADIAPDDPVWDLVGKRQDHLDHVEQKRVHSDDARSCQKAVPGANHRVKVDTSGCTPEQLRAERDAEQAQMFERAQQYMRNNAK